MLSRSELVNLMSFGLNHYVPVLRLKKGELWSLRYVASDVRESVTPIIEVLPSNLGISPSNSDSGIDDAIRTVSGKLWTAWGDRPFFLDTINVGDPAIEPRVIEKFTENAIIEKLSMIPVIGLRSLPSKISATRGCIEKLNTGCSFRLNREDLGKANTNTAVSELLTRLEVTPVDVDLVVDLGVSTGYPPFNYIRDNTPRLLDWRSFTVLSGAFPKDLQGRDPGVHRISRLEWRHWISELTGASSGARMPTFGDYTVQYANYVEPPDFANPSASIRYTSDTEWVLMRGQGIFNEDSTGNKQWPANALLLSEMPEFCGLDFSAGDRYIAEHAGTYQKPGNPTTWIGAAINHHLVFTVRQIRGVQGPVPAAKELVG